MLLQLVTYFYYPQCTECVAFDVLMVVVCVVNFQYVFFIKPCALFYASLLMQSKTHRN